MSAFDPLQTLRTHSTVPTMRKPSTATVAIGITALVSAVGWALGEKTWGLVGFVISGLSWAALYAIFPERK